MPSTPSLTPDELLRYARHLTLAEVGVAGQEKLKAARVLLIGVGGLGSPAALYLAAAGVGTLGIVDSDIVDPSNLQRQVLHDTHAIGEEKTASAHRKLDALNPNVHVEAFPERITAANAREIVRQFDIVIDGSDNFPTRYLVNDACVLERRPLVYGSILRFEGQLSLFATPDGPCYRCLFSEPPPAELVPSCADAGVVGVLPGIIGSLQALEAIKWIVGIGHSARGRLLLFDALALTFREIAVHRDPDCVVCGDHPTVHALIDYEEFCNVGEMRMIDDAAEIGPEELARRMKEPAPPFILDVREEWEFALARLEGSVLIPLGTLPGRIAEVPRGRDVVTLCHHGTRSLRARDFLVRAGFGRVQSLEGGIDAWAAEVDPALRRY